MKLIKKQYLVLVAIILCFIVNVAVAQNLVATLLDQGLKLYAKKDYSGAAAYLGQVVDMAPNHHQARYYLIYSLTSSGDLSKALKHAKILVNKNPGNKQYDGLVGQIEQALALEMKKREKKRRAATIPKEVILGGYKSKQVMRKPKMKTPKIAFPKKRKLTLLDKAILAIDEERFASAAIVLDQVIKKEPKNSKALHYKGLIAFNQGKYSEARNWFNKAVKINSKSFESLFLTGDSYFRQDMLEDAVKAFRKAIKVKSDVFAMLNLAEVLVKLNQLDEAEKIFKKVIDKDPQITEALVGLAGIKLSNGFIKDASQMINEVLTKDSQNPLAHYRKYQILSESELFEDSLEELKIALAHNPDNLRYRNEYALALIKSYNVPKGLEEAGYILKEYPDNAFARLTLAEGLIMSGAYGDAQEHLDRVEAKDKLARTSKLKAIMALRNAEKDKAKAFYNEYLKRSAGLPKSYMEYASFLENNGYISEAIPIYSAIAEKYPKTGYGKRAKQKYEILEAENESKKAVEPKPSRPVSKYRPGKVKF